MTGNLGRIGPYELRGILGRGGTATVYRAFDPQLNREVALKVLTAATDDPALRERFRREAQAVARLRHPHIITLFSFAEHEGRPYLVTELFPNGALSRLLGRPLPLQEIASIVRQIGAALAPLAVVLWSSSGQALGRWGPELQPRGLAHVRRAAAYSVDPVPPGLSRDWTWLVAGALLPDTARNWLWREPAVFDLWKQALVAPALPASLRGLFDGFLLIPPQGATS